jgi:hypothetical protein
VPVRALKVAAATVVAIIVILSVMYVIQSDRTHATAPNTPPLTVTKVIMAQGSVFVFSSNGTIVAANAKSYTVYGMVSSGIDMNITNGTWVTGSWASTTPVAAIIVPLQYIHNESVIGKILSIQKPSSSGEIDMYFGMPTNASSMTVVLMFFPMPQQSGTVTFTASLVLEHQV